MSGGSSLFFWWWSETDAAPFFAPTSDARLTWGGVTLEWAGEELTWGM